MPSLGRAPAPLPGNQSKQKQKEKYGGKEGSIREKGRSFFPRAARCATTIEKKNKKKRCRSAIAFPFDPFFSYFFFLKFSSFAFFSVPADGAPPTSRRERPNRARKKKSAQKKGRKKKRTQHARKKGGDEGARRRRRLPIRAHRPAIACKQAASGVSKPGTPCVSSLTRVRLYVRPPLPVPLFFPVFPLPPPPWRPLQRRRLRRFAGRNSLFPFFRF